MYPRKPKCRPKPTPSRGIGLFGHSASPKKMVFSNFGFLVLPQSLSWVIVTIIKITKTTTKILSCHSDEFRNFVRPPAGLRAYPAKIQLRTLCAFAEATERAPNQPCYVTKPIRCSNMANTPTKRKPLTARLMLNWRS